MSDLPPQKPSLLQALFRWLGDGIVGAIRFWHRLRGASPPAPGAWQLRTEDPSGVSTPRRGMPARMRLLRLRVSRFHRNVPPWRIAALYLTIPTLFAVIAGLSLRVDRPATRPTQEPREDIAFKTLLAETTLLIREKQLDEAEEKLAILKTLRPKHPALLSHAGAIALQREDYNLAKEIYQQALEANPLSFVANYNLAEIEFITGNYRQAATAFQFLSRARPSNEALRFRLFLCALMQDQEEKAREIFQKMSQVGRTPSWYYASAALLYRSQKTQEAEATLAKAQVLYGDKTEPYTTSFAKLGIGHSPPSKAEK